MGALATLLVLIGWLIVLVAGIMLLIVAFKEHILWGLGCLFIPIVSIIFIIINWDKSKNAFFTWIVGVLVILLGAMLGGNAYPHMH
jgi:hypothetical protein